MYIKKGSTVKVLHYNNPRVFNPCKQVVKKSLYSVANKPKNAITLVNVTSTTSDGAGKASVNTSSAGSLSSGL